MSRCASVALLAIVGCSDAPRAGGPRDGAIDNRLDAAAADARVLRDAQLDPDAACAVETTEAEVERQPVDIIWMVDNSSSMEPAISQLTAGINDFADLIAERDLDYRVIMLSLRGIGAREVSGSERYQVCVPQPLASSGCGNGDRFFHVDVDVRSIQLVEQFLGTLGQTDGYRENEARGSAPWRDLLRPEATKTLVFVTDDDSRTCDRDRGTRCDGGDPRLGDTSLEDFPGGGNPFNSNELGPGVRTGEYGDLFEGYTFNAIYGWGSETNPDTRCEYPGGGMPPSPGLTYTALVERTGGVRAQLCAGAAAWEPFFEQIASTVERTSRIACALDIPEPPDDLMLDPQEVNVFVEAGDSNDTLYRVTGPEACDGRGGWHYDDARSPSQVVLCPASCDAAQEAVRTEGAGKVLVQFGCDSLFF